MNEQERILNSIYFEGITSIRAILKGVELGVNDRRIETLYFDKNAIRSKARELSYLKKMSQIHQFPIEYIDRDKIDSMAVGTSHGGILAKCSDRTFRSTLPDSLDNIHFSILLEGIEDPFNFG